MKPVQRLLIGAIVILGGIGGFAFGRFLLRPSAGVPQPIAFNHELHTGELGMTCDTCHEFYESAQHSGLPGLGTCMECHEEPLTESDTEQRIRDLSAAGHDDVFRKLFRMPDHVFYSHRRHAGLAEIPCETCHGDVANSTTPPERALVRVTMDFCTECHESQNVESECTTCHR